MPLVCTLLILKSCDPRNALEPPKFHNPKNQKRLKSDFPGFPPKRLKSGQVRPRQGTEFCNFGAPSPLEALHRIFCFVFSLYVQFSRTSPLKSGESSEKSSGEIASNPVTSVAVMVVSALIKSNPKSDVLARKSRF